MKLLAGALVAAMVICGIYPTLVLELSSAAAAVLSEAMTAGSPSPISVWMAMTM